MDQGKILREACVESLQEAIEAEKSGAERIELCDVLNAGGITPSYSVIEQAKKILRIPVMVMVRPRGGSFLYNSSEIRIMKEDINLCKSLGVSGVVFGFLTPDNHIDLSLTSEMAALAYPLNVTFHKAIDLTKDPVSEAKKLSETNAVTRILTSGGKETAFAGAKVINKMIESVNKKIIIVAAGKVTKENLPEISSLIRTHEFHGRKIVGTLKSGGLKV